MKDILNYKDFQGSVHFSSEDEVFYGRVLGISDLISFEGESVTELKDAFKEAVEDYIDLCKSIDKKPMKSYKGTFNVRIKPDLHQLLARKSNELGLSLNQFVENAIKERLEKV